MKDNQLDLLTLIFIRKLNSQLMLDFVFVWKQRRVLARRLKACSVKDRLSCFSFEEISKQFVMLKCKLFCLLFEWCCPLWFFPIIIFQIEYNGNKTIRNWITIEGILFLLMFKGVTFGQFGVRRAGLQVVWWFFIWWQNCVIFCVKLEWHLDHIVV